MRLIDRLILKELFGPWAFGVGIFTVLIMAGTYLFKITDFIVQGIPPLVILELTILLLPGVIAKTFSMAMLLASLLAFGRLSSDSEVVAMRAAGASIRRMMVPVGVFGFAVSLLFFTVNETVVPAASLRATVIQSEIAKTLDVKATQPMNFSQFDEGRLVANVSAVDFSFQARTLRGVTVVAYNEAGEPGWVMFAKELEYHSPESWRLRGGGRLLSADGTESIVLDGDAWPPQLPKASFTPETLIAPSLKDLDSFSMRQMGEEIAKAKANPRFSPSQIANLEFGYYNKVALPLAALVFGLVGAPLGIRNHRTGVASGFWMSIVIIFGYMLLANFLAVNAQGNVIPASVASLLPVGIGLVCGFALIWRRDTT
ncbi:MAG: LptF/LptG family permease [Fimbriimonadaceae bacterium]